MTILKIEKIDLNPKICWQQIGEKAIGFDGLMEICFYGETTDKNISPSI